MVRTYTLLTNTEAEIERKKERKKEERKKERKERKKERSFPKLPGSFCFSSFSVKANH